MLKTDICWFSQSTTLELLFLACQLTVLSTVSLLLLSLLLLRATLVVTSQSSDT